MRDLETLRKKIDSTQRALHATQSARQRETEALADLWRQIRARFDDQETEITGYRARVNALEDQQQELIRMIESLLLGVEASMSRTQDETVPRIAELAEQLLSSSPETDENESGSGESASRGATVTALAPLDDPDESTSREKIESRSAGIRDLISRVQQSVQARAASEAETAPEDEDDLSRELREIEKLRSELNGLRKRIANSAR